MDPSGGRPFQQFGPVKPVLAADAIPGQAAFADPPVNGFLRDLEQFGYVLNSQLHGSYGLDIPPQEWTTVDVDTGKRPGSQEKSDIENHCRIPLVTSELSNIELMICDCLDLFVRLGPVKIDRATFQQDI